mgnify:FL=1
MNVTIDARAAGPLAAGIGTYAREMVRATGRRGGDHSYLYLTDSDAPGLGLDEDAGRRELCVEASGPLWEQLHLPSELALREVDLYHSPLFTCPVVREVPSVITIHDAIPDEPLWGSQRARDLPVGIGGAVLKKGCDEGPA